MEQGDKPGKHFIKNLLRYTLQPAAIARSQIEGPRLVASDYASCARTCSGERDSEARIPSKGATRRNGYDNRHTSLCIESLRSDN